jgi:hypothetical protein
MTFTIAGAFSGNINIFLWFAESVMVSSLKEHYLSPTNTMENVYSMPTTKFMSKQKRMKTGAK